MKNSTLPDASRVGIACLYFLLVYLWFVQGQTYRGGLLEQFGVLRYLSYLVIFALGAVLALLAALRAETIKRSPGTGFVLVLTLGAYILGVGVYLDSSAQTLAEGSLVYLRYPMLYLMLCHLAIADKVEAFLRFSLLVSVAITLEPLINYPLFGLHGDDAYLTLGPWGGHAVAGVILLYGFCLVSANLVLTGGRWYHIAFIYLVVLALLISSNRGSLLSLAPMIALLFLVSVDRFRPWLLYPLSLAINILVILAAYALYSGDVGLNISQLLNPVYRLHYIGGVYELLESSGHLLTGAGIRSMSPGSAGEAGWVFTALKSQDPRLVKGGTNQYSKALAELGLVGCALYWLLLARILATNIRLWNSIKQRDDVCLFKKSIVLAFFGIWLHFSSFGLFYNDLWRFDASALLFWSLAVFIYSNQSRYTPDPLSSA